MNTYFRWIIFLPAGFILGGLCSLPITLFHSIANHENIFWMSLIKNTLGIYFGILGCAWIVPKSCNPEGFKILMGIILGLILALNFVGFLMTYATNSITHWERLGEILGSILGYITASYWDKNGMKVLLINQKGANLFNAHSKTIQ